eukprot:scaffold4270_cov166-Amphora_coffeaeformis.AAC.1
MEFGDKVVMVIVMRFAHYGREDVLSDQEEFRFFSLIGSLQISRCTKTTNPQSCCLVVFGLPIVVSWPGTFVVLP